MCNTQQGSLDASEQLPVYERVSLQGLLAQVPDLETTPASQATMLHLGLKIIEELVLACLALDAQILAITSD